MQKMVGLLFCLPFAFFITTVHADEVTIPGFTYSSTPTESTTPPKTISSNPTSTKINHIQTISGKSWSDFAASINTCKPGSFQLAPFNLINQPSKAKSTAYLNVTINGWFGSTCSITQDNLIPPAEKNPTPTETFNCYIPSTSLSIFSEEALRISATQKGNDEKSPIIQQLQTTYCKPATQSNAPAMLK